MNCEAKNCTRKAAYCEDHEAWLCDVHREIPAYSPPAKRAPKPFALGAWLSLIPIAPHLAWMALLFVTEGRKPRLGGS